MASVACRVQYLDDSDPFICTNFPEPRRPPTVLLEENSPLSEQIAGIHKLLEAPLKVGHLVRAEPSREPLMVVELVWRATGAMMSHQAAFRNPTN